MNIALVGMMGSGKSTIGKLLLDVIKGFSFVDTDEEIVNQEKISINEIFEQKGEEYFRKIESEVLRKTLSFDNQIVSTGGGIIKSQKNIDLLREKSLVIYLKADSETLFNRVKNNKERPLLNCENMKEKISNILKEREILYENVSHYTVDTKNKQPIEITNEIKEIYAGKCKN